MRGNRLPAMGLWVRRMLALGALLVALAVFPSVAALAETTPPTPPVSSAPATSAPTETSSATPSTPEPEEGDEGIDSPDVALDDTRTILALVGAGVLAVVAGAVVFLRR